MNDSCYIGEIRCFAGNFAPRNWAFCQGQLLSIASNNALFAIIGTTYGGDGRSTFALPDLRGRVAISAGQGSGLSDRMLGQMSGQENHTLNIMEMPSHNHAAQTTIQGGSASGTIKANSGAGDTNSPSNAYPAQPNNVGPTAVKAYSSSNNATMAEDALQINMSGMGASTTVINNGGNVSHNNMQPYTTINYIICLVGIFPSRS